MDSSTRALIDNNRRLRRAIVAMRDGHEAGLQFLRDEGEYGLDLTGPPASLSEALRLAEKVAGAALAIGSGPKEVEIRLVQALLLRFGRHTDACDMRDPNGGIVPCTCAWAGVKAWLESELPDGGDQFCHEVYCDDRAWGEESKP